MKHSEETPPHDSRHDQDDPYNWITPDYRLRWKSDREQLGADLSKASSGNAYSWITKGLITRRFVGASTRILDIGCGWGRNLSGFPHAVGVDIEWRLLRTARTYLSNPLVTGDCNTLPFSSKVFDAVIMTDVIEHLDNPMPALLEIRRVLRPAGRLVLSTPNKTISRFASVPGHMHEYRYLELRELLRNAGFKILSRAGSTIPYPPRYNPAMRQLDSNPMLFRMWRALNTVLASWDALKWDMIILARHVGNGQASPESTQARLKVPEN